MSLYLKMLESKLPENWATLWVENQLLPSLDNNIHCGNSLIDPESYDAFASLPSSRPFGEDADTAFRINRFDWDSRTRGFGRVLDDIGGDRAPVPRLRLHHRQPAIHPRAGVEQVGAGGVRVLQVEVQDGGQGQLRHLRGFRRAGLNLLAPEGLLGFIMPHKFWQAQYGEGLRKVIAEGSTCGRWWISATNRYSRAQRPTRPFMSFPHRPLMHRLSTQRSLICRTANRNAEASTPGNQNRGLFRCARVLCRARVGVYRHGRFAGFELTDLARTTVAPIMQPRYSWGCKEADKVFILERRGKRFYSVELQTDVDLESAYCIRSLRAAST